MAPADIDAVVHRQLGDLLAGIRGLQDSIRRLEEGAVRSEDKAAASRAGVHTPVRINWSTGSVMSRRR